MQKNNNKNIKKIRPGWFCPENVKESFVEFCDLQGVKIQEDFAGALIIWQYLPVQIRQMAKLEAKGSGIVDKTFWEDFRKGLEAAIRDQFYTQNNKPEI
ncbi:MAG: hypothetical protein PVH61_44480 [Candidatus Aminicenantes bacterium]|jgi:hypothetical protein